jgi:serine/threonine protein kinase
LDGTRLDPLLFVPGTAVSIIRDCLLGLSLLHRLGIVHGDIKPANIMLNRGVGRATIVDLGSAFEVSQPPNELVQTPAYAAPEAVDDGMRTEVSRPTLPWGSVRDGGSTWATALSRTPTRGSGFP